MAPTDVSGLTHGFATWNGYFTFSSYSHFPNLLSHITVATANNVRYIAFALKLLIFKAGNKSSEIKPPLSFIFIFKKLPSVVDNIMLLVVTIINCTVLFFKVPVNTQKAIIGLMRA